MVNLTSFCLALPDSSSGTIMPKNVSEGIALAIELANVQNMHIDHQATTVIDPNWATACCPNQSEQLLPHFERGTFSLNFKR
ncbi:hypothetical protein [Acinetobacter venetianus]|uniref:hypothetical protein n=1 Tax=Acinetobacter venetianus TaxID=52133 RepID=UPI003A95301A